MNNFTKWAMGAIVGMTLAIAGVAVAAPTVTQIFNGGTGTGTLPTYGKILVGNSASGYTLMATSTLGIVGGVSSVSSVFGRTGAVTAQNGDYSTLLVTENTNLYFTPARAVTAMTGLYEVPLTFNYPLSRSVNSISTVATSSLNLTVGTFLSPNVSQWTNNANYTTLSAFSGTYPISYNGSGGYSLLGMGTTTASCSGLTSCTPFTVIGASPITISSTGGTGTIATSSTLTAGLLVQSTGWNTIANIATSSLGLSTTDIVQGTNLYFTNALAQGAVSATYPIIDTAGVFSTAISTSTLLSTSLAKGNFLVGNDSNIAQATSTIFISSVGRVGIGTTGPGTKLSVTSASSIDGITITSLNRASVWFNVTNGASNNWLMQNAVSANDDFQILASTAAGGTPSTAVMTLTAGGNVGIGTTSPGAKLDVSGAVSGTTDILRIINTANNGAYRPALSFYNTNPATSQAQISANGGASYNDSMMFFSVADSSRVLQDRMVINSSGNVGIGTTSPTTKLSIDGNQYTSGTAFFGGAITSTSTINGNRFLSVVGGASGAPDYSWAGHTDSGFLYDPISGNRGVMYDSAGSYIIGFGGVGGGITLEPTKVFGWSATSGDPLAALDIGLSRLSANKIALGNGTAGDYTGTLIAGNVGIGTTGPVAKLTIVDQNNALWSAYEYNDGDGVNMRNYRARGTIASPSAILANDRLAAVLAGGYTSAGAFSAPMAGMNIYAAENFTGTAQGTYLSFVNSANGTATAQVERMRIDQNGNVGIGTTSPASKLTVKGHIGTDGLAPALTSCGTSPSIVTGSTDTAGEVTEGTISTGCTITFQTAYARAPFCTATGQAGLVFTYTISASALTITNVGALSSTAVDYHCISNDE